MTKKHLTLEKREKFNENKITDKDQKQDSIERLELIETIIEVNTKKIKLMLLAIDSLKEQKQKELDIIMRIELREQKEKEIELEKNRETLKKMFQE